MFARPGHRFAVMRYTRPRPSTLSEATAKPSFFLSAPLMAPRTECACQRVAFITSAMVAPPLRCRRLRSKASLVPGRSEVGNVVFFSFEADAARFDLLALRWRPADRFESWG